MGRALRCHGTAYVGRVEGGVGEIRVVFCDAGRTIAVDAGEGREVG